MLGDISLPGRLKRPSSVSKGSRRLCFRFLLDRRSGPRGEFLYTSRGTGVAASPINILSPQAEWGVARWPNPSLIGNVSSKTIFQLCGGYRPEFYFGQDWDLWYRLASLGTFCTLQKTLCVCRITLGSISGSRKQEQKKFAATVPRCDVDAPTRDCLMSLFWPRHDSFSRP